VPEDRAQSAPPAAAAAAFAYFGRAEAILPCEAVAFTTAAHAIVSTPDRVHEGDWSLPVLLAMAEAHGSPLALIDATIADALVLAWRESHAGRSIETERAISAAPLSTETHGRRIDRTADV
jgi:hypothetical protein